MAIETKEKEIKGSIYTVTQLPARRALRLKTKLIKLFGASLAQLVLNQPEEKKDKQAAETEYDKVRIKDIYNSGVVKSIQFLCQNLNENTLEELIVELMQGVRRDGVELVPAQIDHLFAGDLGTLYTVILFVLEVNYADFFEREETSDTGSPSEGLQALVQTTRKTYGWK